MDSYASERFLSRDLQRLGHRIEREGWVVCHQGIIVEATLPRHRQGDSFRILLVCHGYPRRPMAATFLPDATTGAFSRWPVDGEYVFRAHAPVPFICLPGLLSYSPEGEEVTNPYAEEDLHVGAILGRLADAINDERCTGSVLRGPQ